MVRGITGSRRRPTCSAHARGDGPVACTSDSLSSKFSPRTWGWSLPQSSDRIAGGRPSRGQCHSAKVCRRPVLRPNDSAARMGISIGRSLASRKVVSMRWKPFSFSRDGKFPPMVAPAPARSRGGDVPPGQIASLGARGSKISRGIDDKAVSVKIKEKLGITAFTFRTLCVRAARPCNKCSPHLFYALTMRSFA